MIGEAGFCGLCLTVVPDGPDACLGHIQMVNAACCGHGVREPYVAITDASPRTLRGREALLFFELNGVGPSKGKTAPVW